MSGSFIYKLIADATKYKQDLIDAGLATEKQATKMAQKWAASQQKIAEASAQAGAKAAAEADKVAKATEKAGGKADKAGEAIGKFGSSAQKLSGGLRAVSPALGDVAGAFNDLADFGEVGTEVIGEFGTAIKGNVLALGTLGLALAAGSLVYQSYARDVAQIIELRKFEADTAKSLESGIYALRDAQIKEMVAVGQLTDAEADDLKIKLGTQKAVSDYLLAQQAKIDAIQADIDSTKKYIDLQRGLAAALAVTYDLTTGLPNTLTQMAKSGQSLSEVLASDARALNSVFDGLTGLESGAELGRAKIKNLSAAAAENTARLKETQEYLLTAADAERHNAEETKNAADTTRDRAAAEKELADALKSAEEQNKAYVDFLTYARNIESKANESQLSEIEKLDKAHHDQVVALNIGLQEQLTANALDANKQYDLKRQTNDTLLALDREYQAERAQLSAEAAQAILDQETIATAKFVKPLTELSEAALQTASDVFGSISGLSSSLVDAGIAKSSTGLKVLFGIQQAAAASQAGINTTLAISNALALPLPPPLPQIAAVAAGVAGVAQEAAILSQEPPSFRSGYLPDQRLAYFEPASEAIVPATGIQAMGGQEKAHETFAGVSPQNQAAPTVTRFMLGHREFSAMVANSANRPGPLRNLSVRPLGRMDPYRNKR